jgi:hypothetical protein
MAYGDFKIQQDGDDGLGIHHAAGLMVLGALAFLVVVHYAFRP